MSETPPTPGPDDEQQALVAAMRALLLPLARLAVERGLPYAVLEETLKQSIVQAAAQAHPGIPAHRSVSRIATATGINRREVTRLVLQRQPEGAPPARSLATEVYTHWLSAPEYRDAEGQPRVLPRLGPAPSFESLAQAITRDVHARSLLDELLRLKMATLDETADTVRPRGDGFVPSGDRVRMLGFLAANVGDHLSAGVDNVLADGRRHFEQALFADGLSDASVQAVRALIAPQWKLLLQTLVPPLEKHVAEDEALPAAAQRRVRIGLYAFDEATEAARAAQAQAPADPARPAAAPRRRPRKR
ncbi:MAG: hypothetical protein JNJ71_10040 [Rubrivivax sp.]|nr:hypothetical protein [Rubrivivax sp.]